MAKSTRLHATSHCCTTVHPTWYSLLLNENEFPSPILVPIDIIILRVYRSSTLLILVVVYRLMIAAVPDYLLVLVTAVLVVS